MSIINVINTLDFSYPENGEFVYRVEKTFSILPNKIYSISGISGSGKSTILTLLAGLRKFDKGTIEYSFSNKKVRISDENWKKTVTPDFWRHIGFSFQKPELIRAFNVLDNLKLTLNDTDIEKMALSLFKEDEWENVKFSKIWKISGGQIQRLGIIRAFGIGQKLIFMDEPTNNLDESNRGRVADFINLYSKNRTIILVSHDTPFLEMLNIEKAFHILNIEKDSKKIRVLL